MLDAVARCVGCEAAVNAVGIVSLLCGVQSDVKKSRPGCQPLWPTISWTADNLCSSKSLQRQDAYCALGFNFD
jgi:hypothetical protein